jgi:hypothetical protein
MMVGRFLLLATMTMALAACSPTTVIVRQMTDLVDDGMIAFERDDDLDLIEKAIPANIKLLEVMLANSPDDCRLITLLSRFYGSYAFGFAETRLEKALYLDPPAGTSGQSVDRIKDQVNHYYEKGLGYALTALEKNEPGATEAFNKVNTIAPYLDRLDRKSVAPLFWYGFNLGAWVNRNRDSIRAVSRAHVARKVMERVIDIDPAYNHGGRPSFPSGLFRLTAAHDGRQPGKGTRTLSTVETDCRRKIPPAGSFLWTLLPAAAAGPGVPLSI